MVCRIFASLGIFLLLAVSTDVAAEFAEDYRSCASACISRKLAANFVSQGVFLVLIGEKNSYARYMITTLLFDRDQFRCHRFSVASSILLFRLLDIMAILIYVFCQGTQEGGNQ